ncbi:hypothetical protein F5Y08DRAFT_339407 [Xylaria arbuscula]|nr:hypothetical protein F5Y08DRAFT_339407 [Xylaria arbuscula]
MAPSTKGTNPAPNYTVAMNQVQTQIEAQLRIVRSFMPSSHPPALSLSSSSSTTTTATKPTPSFSALASTSIPSSKNPSLRQRTQQQQQDEESLFAETRAQDPNAGLGFGISSSKRAAERAKERETQLLRSRLLGRKRGVGAAGNDAAGARRRRGEDDSSSDEEPGRSGLGRAKKRARVVPPREEEIARLQPEAVHGSEEEEPRKSGAAQLDDEDGVQDENAKEEVIVGKENDGDVEYRLGNSSLHQVDSVPLKGEQDVPDQKTKKRKRKKKGKKDKSKEATSE